MSILHRIATPALFLCVGGLEIFHSYFMYRYIQRLPFCCLITSAWRFRVAFSIGCRAFPKDSVNCGWAGLFL